MSPFSVRSRRAVDGHVGRLWDRFGSFPVETVTVENEREFFKHGVEIFEAGVRGAAGGWIFDEAGVRGEVVDVWTPIRNRFVLESSPERRRYLLNVSFDVQYVGGEAGRYPERWDDDGDEEILAVQWFSTPLDDVADGIADRVNTWAWPD